jgi:hypothetical protein
VTSAQACAAADHASRARSARRHARLAATIARLPLRAGHLALQFLGLVHPFAHLPLHGPQHPLAFPQHMEVIVLGGDRGLRLPLLIDEVQAFGQTGAPVLGCLAQLGE